MSDRVYEVRFAIRAEAGLLAVPTNRQTRLLEKIEALGLDPRPRGCEKIKGEKDLLRIRLGDYRVVYQVQDSVLLVVVVAIGHRRDVYERL